MLVSECHILAGGNKAQKIDPSSVGHVTVLHAACKEGDTAVIELLLDLSRETGTALVLVTHNAAHAAKAGRMLFLHEGKMQ